MSKLQHLIVSCKKFFDLGGIGVRKNLMQYWWMAGLAAALLLGSTSASASMIISATSVSAAQGTIGASFDVNIQNTGLTPQNIAAFSVALSVGTANITFTAANESTVSTYIYNGDSFDINNGFDLATISPQSLEASDLSDSGVGLSIGAGATFGLAHVIFDINGATPVGPITLTVISTCVVLNQCTSLADSSGGNVAFTTQNGTLLVTAATGTPEPSTFLLALLAVPLALIRRRRVS